MRKSAKEMAGEMTDFVNTFPPSQERNSFRQWQVSIEPCSSPLHGFALNGLSIVLRRITALMAGMNQATTFARQSFKPTRRSNKHFHRFLITSLTYEKGGGNGWRRTLG